MRLHFTGLERMIDKITDTVCKLEAKVYGQLPSQVVVNQRHELDAMTLRGGRILEDSSAEKKRQA